MITQSLGHLWQSLGTAALYHGDNKGVDRRKRLNEKNREIQAGRQRCYERQV